MNDPLKAAIKRAETRAAQWRSEPHALPGESARASANAAILNPPFRYSDLWALPEEAFVEQAVRILWRRSPDPELRRALLSRLARGMARAELLWRLRLQHEGRLQNVRLHGLARRLPLALLSYLRSPGNKTP